MKAYARWTFAMMTGLGLSVGLACSSPPPNDQGGGAAGTGGAGGSATGGTAGAGGGTGGAAGSADDAGGTGGAAGSADAGPTPEQACAHLAAVSCQKYSECLPWYVPINFGDIDTCVTRYAATLCRNLLGIEGSGDTPAALEECAAARTSATCAQWFDNDIAVSACLPRPGTGATGSACGIASQCQTTNCQVRAGADCGTCGGPLVGAGAPCTSSNECASNLQCFDGVCGLPRGLGEPCSTAGACQFAFQCVNGRCVVPAKAGEPCSMLECSSRAGVFCNNGVCQPRQVVGTGERCDVVEGPYCSRAGFCKTDMITSNGICVAAPAEGEACNDSLGPYCMRWASCVGGFCKIGDPGMCK